MDFLPFPTTGQDHNLDALFAILNCTSLLKTMRMEPRLMMSHMLPVDGDDDLGAFVTVPHSKLLL